MGGTHTLQTIHQLVDGGHMRRVQINEFEVLQPCSSDSLVKHVKKLGVELQPFFASIDPSRGQGYHQGYRGVLTGSADTYIP